MSDNKIIHHASPDPFEINFIMGGGNKERFEEIGVRIERPGMNGITFTSTKKNKGINMTKFNEMMEEILTKYRKNIRRSIYITSDEVAYFRGSESNHLKKVKENTMVEHVFFNNKDDENGNTMVEVAVIGNSLCVDRFMSELLRSISSFKQKKLGFKPPPRPERPSRTGASVEE